MKEAPANATKEGAGQAEQTMVVVDGSVDEGGGQVVRTAVALAAAAGKSVAVKRIRAKRIPPGLRPQHVLGVRLLASVTSASLEGDEKNSERVELVGPKSIQGGEYQCHAETPASCTLLAQCAIPPLLFGQCASHVQMTGGTDVPMAPSIDYLTHVFAPNFNRCLQPSGVQLQVECKKRGFIPRGGGRVALHITPTIGNTLRPFECVSFGRLNSLQLVSFGAAEASKVATNAAMECIKERLQMEACCTTDSNYQRSKHGSLLVAAISEDGWVLGASVPLVDTMKLEEASQAGRATALDVLSLLKRKGCADSHMQDQLLVFMAMAQGVSKLGSCCAPTPHALAVMRVAEQVVGAHFTVKDPHTNTEPWIITCQGAGLKRL